MDKWHNYRVFSEYKVKQSHYMPEQTLSSRRLRVPDFKKIGK
jgi:hypothetical protein